MIAPDHAFLMILATGAAAAFLLCVVVGLMHQALHDRRRIGHFGPERDDV